MVVSSFASSPRRTGDRCETVRQISASPITKVIAGDWWIRGIFRLAHVAPESSGAVHFLLPRSMINPYMVCLSRYARSFMACRCSKLQCIHQVVLHAPFIAVLVAASKDNWRTLPASLYTFQFSKYGRNSRRSSATTYVHKHVSVAHWRGSSLIAAGKSANLPHAWSLVYRIINSFCNAFVVKSTLPFVEAAMSSAWKVLLRFLL